MDDPVANVRMNTAKTCEAISVCLSSKNVPDVDSEMQTDQQAESAKIVVEILNKLKEDSDFEVRHIAGVAMSKYV